MKIFTFLIVALLVSLNNYCQVMYSNNGYLLPPEGGYRVLVVYAQVDYSVGGCPNPGDTYETNGEWPTGGAPYWETSGGPYPTSKPLFDVDYITYGSGTLSDYYFQASLGENFLLGDYYSISIPCTANGLSGSRAQAVINYLNANPGTSAAGKEFTRWLVIRPICKGCFCA